MGKESFETTSGLLDDFDLVVEEDGAWFGVNEDSKRNPDKLFLHLRGVAYVDGEVEDEEYTERFSIGNGFEVWDDGEAVGHGSGKHRFNRQSGLGRVLTRISELGDDVLSALAEKGDANEAKTWAGWRYHFERKVVSKFKNDEGEEIVVEMPLPTSIEPLDAKPAGRGARSGGSAGSSSSRGRGRAAAKEEPEDAPEEKPATRGRTRGGSSGSASTGRAKGGSNRAETALRKKLVELATQFDPEQFEDFVEVALDENPKIEDHPAVKAAVLDDGDEGIFAEGQRLADELEAAADGDE